MDTLAAFTGGVGGTLDVVAGIVVTATVLTRFPFGAGDVVTGVGDALAILAGGSVRAGHAITGA